MSYTTSDDGMLRMCHTSLAPTKPRRWTKGDNLGEGSYGSVWLALNGDTGELFALKEVRVGSSDKHRDESIEQLEQEVDVLSRLVHPNIVRYIGITRQETALYIFLEYVPGGSIASLVQRFGKFEENVIRVYTRQILIGLAYLHSQRVVHRDIKGANILVEKSGRIKPTVERYSESCVSITFPENKWKTQGTQTAACPQAKRKCTLLLPASIKACFPKPSSRSFRII